MKDLKISETEFDVNQSATFLRIPKSTLYSYPSTRAKPNYKQGKRLVIKSTDLEKWLIESKKKTVAEIDAEVSQSNKRKGGKIK